MCSTVFKVMYGIQPNPGHDDGRLSAIVIATSIATAAILAAFKVVAEERVDIAFFRTLTAFHHFG